MHDLAEAEAIGNTVGHGEPIHLQPASFSRINCGDKAKPIAAFEWSSALQIIPPELFFYLLIAVSNPRRGGPTMLTMLLAIVSLW